MNATPVVDYMSLPFPKPEDLFPIIPLLNPSLEEDLESMMGNHERRICFFSKLSFPESLDWYMIKNETIKVLRYDHDGEEMCPVCLDKLVPGDYYIHIECKHIYHYGCLSKILCKFEKVKCPMCRRDITF